MNNYKVYLHTFPNGKKYIGMTSQKIERRSRSDGSGYKLQPELMKAIQEIGWNNIEHKILKDNLSKKEAEKYEYYYIKKYNTNNIEYGYNIANGGHDENSFTKEIKNKISNSHKGVKFSEQRRKNISTALKGRKLSEEHKNKIGLSSKGRKSRLGKKLSNESKRLISESLKKFHKQNSGLTYWNGKHHTEETKEKMRQNKLGKINPSKWKAVIKLDLDNKEIKEYKSLNEAAKDLNIKNSTNITACCKGKIKTAYGYKWKYKES